MSSSASADITIAILDGQQIIESSLAYQDITSQVEKKATLYKENATKTQEVLQKKYKELEAQKSILSTDAYGKKAKEFEGEAQIAQESAYMDKMSLDKAYGEAMKSLENKITEIVKDKAIAMKFDIVTTKASIIYHTKELDITSAVLEDLNKALPKVTVSFENAQTLKSDVKRK